MCLGPNCCGCALLARFIRCSLSYFSCVINGYFLVRIGEHLVGLVDFFEHFFGGFWIVRVFVLGEFGRTGWNWRVSFLKAFLTASCAESRAIPRRL